MSDATKQTLNMGTVVICAIAIVGFVWSSALSYADIQQKLTQLADGKKRIACLSRLFR